MAVMAKQTLPKAAWLLDYTTRDKPFNDMSNPRVIDIVGRHCSVVSPARDFARLRREFAVSDERAEGHGFVFSWGLHELNPADPEDVAKAMRAVERFFDRLPESPDLLVAQADGKGGNFHIHGVKSNVVMADCEVNGQRYRAGSSIGGKALDIEWMREQFDECCRLEGLGQTLEPYVKGDRRSGLDAAARRAGKRTNNDICKDAVEGAICSGARTLQEFEYELGARGVELRVERKVAGKYAGQTWLAYRPVGAKGWTRDQFMGLERYGHDAVMAGLADPTSRTPRTVNPLPGPPKPLPVPTAEQLEVSAAVVDDLTAKGRARGYGSVPAPAGPKKPAKPIMLTYLDPVRREGASPDTFGMAMAKYTHEEIDDAVAYWEWEQSQAKTAQPVQQVEPTTVEPVEDSTAVDEAVKTVTTEEVATTPVVIDEPAGPVDLTAQERSDAEVELLQIRHRAITEGATLTDEQYGELMDRADALKERLDIDPDDVPSVDEVLDEYEMRCGSDELADLDASEDDVPSASAPVEKQRIDLGADMSPSSASAADRLRETRQSAETPSASAPVVVDSASAASTGWRSKFEDWEPTTPKDIEAKPVLLAFDQLAHGRLAAGQPVLEAEIPEGGIGPTTIEKHRERWDDSTLGLLESRETKKAYGQQWFQREKTLNVKLEELRASTLSIDPRRVELAKERDTAGNRWRTAREEMKAGNYVTPEHLTEAERKRRQIRQQNQALADQGKAERAAKGQTESPPGGNTGTGRSIVD